MAAQGGEHVYATLLLNDAYLPGALVLAHSLRDAGTTKKLAVLVTLDSVSADVITQLKAVYDHIIPVPRIRNEKPANLFLMNRGDLHSAFTKINLWKQTQFSKIVYVDADIVAYRAPDELFDLAAPFSAAPDIGWPDLFNTGLMVLTPNMGDYYALMAMAERGISFDGADQGLLNLHFKNTYNRISFTYNVTPSAHYQYVPAYRHFQSGISLVHFIGTEKPWFQGRHASKGDSPFDEMVGRWWAVYDRHYRVQEPTTGLPQQPAVPEIIQYFVKGEFQPKPTRVAPTGEHYHEDHRDPSYETSSRQPPYQPPDHDDHCSHQQHHHHYQHQHREPPHDHHQQHQYHHEHHEHHHHGHGQESRPESSPHQTEHSFPPSNESFSTVTGTLAEARQEQIPVHHERDPPPPPPVEQKHEPSPPPVEPWDAQRQPPPSDSRPEAHNFPVQIYEMSQDPAPFVPPERYPSPPKNMWYEVPREPPTQKPRAIFPWETHQPKPSRIFTGDSGTTLEDESTPFGEHKASYESRALAEPSLTGSSVTGHKSEPITPATPTIRIVPSDPWGSFARSNAWDDVPEIERYVEGLQKHRRAKSQGSGTSVGPSVAGSGVDRGLRLTDFPSEVERPSLPVTPAPIRRPKFWGGGGPGTGDGDDDELLPAAEGVPPQSDWDPVAQLQKLARQQSEVLLRKLGGGDGSEEGVSRDIPARSLPYGSEGVKSPTYVAQSSVLSPQPVKGSTTTSMVRNMVGDQDTSSTPRTASMESTATTVIQEPSYGGPGLAWEKGEDFPIYETPLPPTDEERDVLDT